MSWDREKRGIFQRKQEKPQIKKHIPLKSEGNDGDITIRQLDDGVFLFFKALGKWYKTLNTSSEVRPETPNSMQLGSPAQPLGNMFISSHSIHIGNTKSEQGKISLSSDKTELVFKNKAGDERVVVGKKTGTSAGTAVTGTISLGEDNVSNKEGVLHLGSGGSNNGGIITSSSDYTESAMGLRVLQPATSGSTMQHILSAKTTTAIAVANRGVILSTYDGPAGAISLYGADTGSTEASGLAGMGTIWVSDDDKLYYRFGTGTAVDLTSVTSGTATPSTSNVADKTPAIGDVYIQYPSGYSSNGINNQYASGTSAPIIYVRVSDDVVLKMYNTGTNYRCKEHVDNGYTTPTPASASITLCDSSYNALSSYYLVGQSLNAYVKCTYNADVTGNVYGGPPQADFNTGSNIDFDTSNSTRTSGYNTSFSGRSRDSLLNVGWVANGATEGGVAVGDGASTDYIYARNKKLWGACTGVPNASALSSASSITSANNQYYNIGTKSISNTSGQRVFFAIPSGTTAISSIVITGNPTNQIEGFATTTATYTNSNGYAEAYTIRYSQQQGASTTSWEVG